MLNQFKKSNIFKYKTLLLISLISIIQAQEISKNKYSLVLAPNASNQWWSTYNQEGVKPSDHVQVEIKYASGDIKKIKTLCRIDTKNELEYYKNGGILQYVLRNMI